MAAPFAFYSPYNEESDMSFNVSNFLHQHSPLIHRDPQPRFIPSPSVIDFSTNSYQSSLDYLSQNFEVETLKGPQGVHMGSSETSCISQRLKKVAGATSKKSIHKLIERKRREDLKSLCIRLRSLLPQKHLKGKRSTADQLLEAINYIHHLKKKVDELAKEREDKRCSQIGTVPLEVVQHGHKDKIGKPLTFSRSEDFPMVKVHLLRSIIEVRTNTYKYQILFSHILFVMEEEGLQVVSAASSATNDKIFHTIHAKASDIQRFESTILYQKLWQLVRENKSNTSAVES